MDRPGKVARECRWCDPKRGHPSVCVCEKNRTVEEPPRVKTDRSKLVCPEILSGKRVAPQMFRGVLVVRRNIREDQNLSLHPDPENRYMEVWCISTLPGVSVLRPKLWTRNETRPRFLGPETRPEKRVIRANGPEGTCGATQIPDP